jgi:hypothetical protein
MRRTLRELGHYEAYEANLAPEPRAALDATPAGIWIAVSLARAHLEACNALRLPEHVALEMGRGLGSRLHSPVLGLALRLAGAAGATPMLLAEKAVKLWPQRNDGGDLLIVQETRSSARIELLGYTLADIPYARLVWRGNLETIAQVILRRARVTEIREACDEQTLAYAMTW